MRRAGHRVVEVNRGDRRTRRAAGKSDTIDAEVAARSVLAGQSTAIPKTADGAVEMMRQLKITRDTAVKARTTAMNTLKQIVVNAPPHLREALHALTDSRPAHALRRTPTGPPRHAHRSRQAYSRGPSNHRQRCPVRRCGDSRAGGRGVKSSTVQPGLAPGRCFLQHSGRNHLRSGDVVPSPGTDQQLKAFLRDTLGAFPWRIRVSDWTGQQYSLGLGEPHWRGLPLEVHLRSKAAGHDLLSLNALAFLDRFVRGEVDLRGNLYLLSDIRHPSFHRSQRWTRRLSTSQAAGFKLL